MIADDKIAAVHRSPFGPTRTSSEVCYCTVIRGTADLIRIVICGGIYEYRPRNVVALEPAGALNRSFIGIAGMAVSAVSSCAATPLQPSPHRRHV
jgi:hypothetical protein